MPKRAPPPAAVAPIDSLVPPPPPSPLVQKLRQDYRWAAISEFCFTFADAFGSLKVDVETLEADIDGDETQVIPDLIVKLLFALTYNRLINRENAMENVRKQYEKRQRPCPLGTVEEPVEWATLGLGSKVQVLYELCELQMEDPARFRGLLKTEEEATSWRIDPCGWDKNGNTYWLFDDNRLWIQRVPPKPPAPPRPPKKSSLKAKRALKRERQSTSAKPAASLSKASRPSKSRQSIKREYTPEVQEPKKEEEPVSGTRRRTQVAFYGNPTPTAQALKRGGSTVATPASAKSMRSTRAHPLEVKAESSTTADTPVRGGAKGKGKAETPASLPRGTRVSRRLRDTEGEWQQVPPEWLAGEQPAGSSRTSRSKANGIVQKNKTANGDDESELSDLTDEEEHEAKVRASGIDSVNPSPVKPTVEAMDVDPPQTNGQSSSSSALSELDAEEEEAVPTSSDPKDVDFEPSTDDLTPAPESGKPSVGADETEVEEDEEEEAKADTEQQDGDVEMEDDDVEAEDDVALAMKEANSLPEGFVEWEAVCVTLYDWRTFPEQFAKSRDADEKALYRYLTIDVGPPIIEVLIAAAEAKAREEAVNNRKRSSRIATKELEREEIIRRETAQREMEERMERTQREEARKQKAEDEAARQEKAREDRLKEREERVQAREEAILAKAKAESDRLEKAERDRQERARRREEGLSVVSTPNRDLSAARGGSEQQEGWELACEVCRKTGWNLDDDEDVVACEDCGRWQHMGCHDMQDMREGRRKRNWEKVDFRCQECLVKLAKRQPAEPVVYQSMPQHPQPAQSPYQNGHAGQPGPSNHNQTPNSNPAPRDVRHLPSPPDGRTPMPAPGSSPYAAAPKLPPPHSATPPQYRAHQESAPRQYTPQAGAPPPPMRPHPQHSSYGPYGHGHGHPLPQVSPQHHSHQPLPPQMSPHHPSQAPRQYSPQQQQQPPYPPHPQHSYPQYSQHPPPLQGPPPPPMMYAHRPPPQQHQPYPPHPGHYPPPSPHQYPHPMQGPPGQQHNGYHHLSPPPGPAHPHPQAPRHSPGQPYSPAQLPPHHSPSNGPPRLPVHPPATAPRQSPQQQPQSHPHGLPPHTPSQQNSMPRPHQAPHHTEPIRDGQ